jgi:hypothetical protein
MSCSACAVLATRYVVCWANVALSHKTRLRAWRSSSTCANARFASIFPAVERELTALLEQRLVELRARFGADVDVRVLDDELVFRTRTGQPENPRNVAQRGVLLFAGRTRGVDPIEAPQMTGHSPVVWAKHYARSFGKAQRDEARDRMLSHGFGAVTDNDEDEVRVEDEAAAAS